MTTTSSEIQSILAAWHRAKIEDEQPKPEALIGLTFQADVTLRDSLDRIGEFVGKSRAEVMRMIVQQGVSDALRYIEAVHQEFIEKNSTPYHSEDDDLVFDEHELEKAEHALEIRERWVKLRQRNDELNAHEASQEH
jgi:hypothetical protein